MFEQPYTIVVNGTGSGAGVSSAAATTVTERKLGTCGTEANHCAGDVLSPSVKLVSSAVASKDNLRTVVLTRPMVGATKDHFTFDSASDSTI
jgi:hypothetical protein